MKPGRALLLIAACSFFSLSAHAERLTLGVIGDFSGPAKSYGTAVKNGVQLALEEQGDGVITAVYEDDGFVNFRTVGAFKKLISQDKADVVFSTASGPSNSIAPLAETAKVLLIAWASDPKVSLGRSYVFRSWVSGQREGMKIASEAMRTGAGKTAVYTSITDYAISVREGFNAVYPAANIGEDKDCAADLADFKPLLLQSKSKGIRSFFICLAPSQSALISKQAREIGYESPQFFGCENLYNMDEVKASAGALNGAWFVTSGVTDAFRQKYIKRFNTEDSLSGAAINYDIANLLHELVLKGVPSAELHKALLTAGTRPGGIGEYTPRDEGGDRYFDISLIVREITQNGFIDRTR